MSFHQKTTQGRSGDGDKDLVARKGATKIDILLEKDTVQKDKVFGQY